MYQYQRFAILLRGGGDIATGIALRLYRSGFRRLIILETARPLAVRRRVAFSEAVYEGLCTVEGISAALAFNPEEEVEENTRAMTEAAEHVHTASITYAVRDTNFDNREIHSGDIMGLLDNKLTYLGHDVREVALHMADEMVNEDAALVTVYYGSDVSEEDARQLTDEIAEKYPECDVAMQFGGQPLYYYLIAVE